MPERKKTSKTKNKISDVKKENKTLQEQEKTNEIEENLFKEEVDLKESSIMDDKIKKNSYLKNMFQTIILICACICIIYGLYTLFFKKDDNKTTNNKQYEQGIQLKEVNVLYSYISDTFLSSPFHETSELTLSEIDENVLFDELIISKKFNEETYESLGCVDYDQPCKVGEIQYDEALSELKRRYGNVNLTRDNYSYGLMTCNKTDNKYECYITLGGIESPINNVSNMTNYIETDGKLEIYDKYFTYELLDNVQCYTDNSRTELCNNQEQLQNDLNKLTKEQLLDKYGKEYVHTFIKDLDGNYYWYSSKPTNSN